MAPDDSEVDALEKELLGIQQLIASLQETEKDLLHKLRLARHGPSSRRAPDAAGGLDLAGHDALVDFTSPYDPSGPEGSQTPWKWTTELKETMAEVWGIQQFRFPQQAVCNAVLSGRDVVVIMPTGGGKSLTYQLPAILSHGTTLVISPLVALMSDQIMHLQQAGVEAEMFSAATSRSDAGQIAKRLLGAQTSGQKKVVGPSAKGKGTQADPDSSTSIKLCYVTPEKIAKSKSFVSTLQKMYQVQRLARIVIDEAHCCSSMGHDFRPDYKQLSLLKTLFPETPIIAVTATCPPHVLTDILKILKLNPVTDARKADKKGTVLFTAPLNRPNLHYQVLKKSSSANDVIDQMVAWIIEHHSGCQGIVYALSQKDTVTVAEGIEARSKGRIRTGTYHASLPDSEKQKVHLAWRGGSIQVVCATTAFGMGIDAPRVRFVIHHTLPKSLEGYYQESGRAGRDGRPSDCLLYWKTTDLMRLSGMLAAGIDGISKLYSMIEYAVDLKTCRNTLFANYFNTAPSRSECFESLPFQSAPCGQCDNCLRDQDTIHFTDLTAEGYKTCQVVRDLDRMGVNLTLIQLSDVMRGCGPSLSLLVKQQQSRKNQEQDELDDQADLATVEEHLSSKFTIKKELMEDLVLQLLLKDYLSEKFVATAYTVNSYMRFGRRGPEFFARHDAAVKRSSAGVVEEASLKILVSSGVLPRKPSDSNTAVRPNTTGSRGGRSATGSRQRGFKVKTTKKRFQDDMKDSEALMPEPESRKVSGKKAKVITIDDSDSSFGV